ncbi:mandelate racemase/muconate lactonizing enzyme family protein [Novosphingopyxis sp.]|uniref:mandelate racemase/muconate lactonizing enzyme family protein n=1 Tax=Novosphingopyxis sp. TaxID=2709690 RepID=UPI003B5CE0DF
MPLEAGIKDSVRSAKISLLKMILDRPVGGSGVTSVDVIVVDLSTADGRAAFGFSYSLGGEGALVLHAAESLLRRFVIGQPISHPEAAARIMSSSLNRIGGGVHRLAMCAIDVALWDLWSGLHGLSVGQAMGGLHRRVPVYGSGGFNTVQSAAEAAETADEHVLAGFAAVKPRLTGKPSDFAVLDAVAKQIGESIGIMLDANEKCALEEAMRLKSAALEHKALFLEEPLPAHDLEGYRQLRMSPGVPIATGEHLQGLVEARPMISEAICAVIQPDLAAMGGLTECLRVARFAEAHGISVTPHFLPQIFIHLAAASPAVTWLEDFPLLEPLFSEAPQYDVQGGLMPGPEVIGLGFDILPEQRAKFCEASVTVDTGQP